MCRFSPCTIASVRSEALTLGYGVKAMSFIAHAPQAALIRDADIHADKKSYAVTRPIRVPENGELPPACIDASMNIEGNTTCPWQSGLMGGSPTFILKRDACHSGGAPPFVNYPEERTTLNRLEVSHVAARTTAGSAAWN